MSAEARLLLIDDDDVLVALAEASLRHTVGTADVVIERASTLAEGVEMAAAGFDAVVLDLGLPDSPKGSPLEALRVFLQATEATMPVVVLTGQREEMGQEAMRLGAQDFLPKQSDVFPALLWRTVSYAIERHAHARRLDEQRRELQRANAQLQHFAASVSHDIRAPISTALFGLATMQELGEDLEDPVRRQIVDGAVTSLRRVNEYTKQLIEELLAPSDEHGATVDLRALVDTILPMLGEESRARLHVRVDGETTLDTRPATMRQILQNLLANAVRHNPDREVQVQVTAERTPAALVITVADDGRGIPEDAAVKVFELGFKGSDTGQTGVGLSAVKLNVESLGGTVEIVASHLGGAAFEIRLPA